MPDSSTGAWDVVLWGVFPYIMLVILAGGLIWRHRYDQFGWTTRSSQLNESRLLRLASPLFHFGILAVIVGHVVGLLIPIGWTEAVGVTQGFHHLNALLVGGIAGIGTLGGAALLIHRRRASGPVFAATTANDKMMYVVLLAAILFGLLTTVLSVFAADHEHNYRETVSPWFRSIFLLQPDVASMAGAPLSFRIHTVVGMVLFVIWPFTRLVHALTAPIHCLFRPYIVYRSRDKDAVGARRRRGWSVVGTSDRAKD